MAGGVYSLGLRILDLATYLPVLKKQSRGPFNCTSCLGNCRYKICAHLDVFNFSHVSFRAQSFPGITPVNRKTSDSVQAYGPCSLIAGRRSLFGCPPPVRGGKIRFEGGWLFQILDEFQ